MSSRQNYFVRKYPRTVRVLLWIWFVVFTVIAAYLIVASMTDLFDPTSDGAKGTVVITSCDNEVKFRHCFGNFTSDDGTVRLTNVQIGGEDGGRPGQRFTAFGDASTKSVIVPSGSEHATDIGVSAVLLLAWLAQFYLLVYRPRKQRRAAVA